MIPIDVLFNKADYGLTEENQEFVKNNYSKYSLVQLARIIFEKNSIDDRSKEVKDIKNFINRAITRKHSALELSPSQREEIERLSVSVGPVELARRIFNDQSLAPLSKEVKTVDKYIKVIGLNQCKTGEYEDNDSTYRPPKAVSKLIVKINGARHDANYVEDKLTGFQKKTVEALRGFLHNNRFLATINGIKDPYERNLFESEFINGVLDKPDLNSEELNMYVSLCSDYVILKQIKEQLDMLNEELRSSVEDTDKGIKMALTEAFGKKSKEYDDCAKRIKSMQESLSGIRSKRMENSFKQNSSLIVFVDAWKQEDERKKLILIAKAKEKECSSTMQEIETLEEYVARVMGISQEEVLNG